MIDLRNYQHKLENLARKFNLGNLCGCQLREFSKEVGVQSSGAREQLLAMIYWESLLQGFVYTYDRYNYWPYISLIQNMQISMSYHGGGIQFRLLLLIPQSDISFDEVLLAQEVQRLGETLLPRWLELYCHEFGCNAGERIRNGVLNDHDVRLLVSEFSFLKEPIETTFGTMGSA